MPIEGIPQPEILPIDADLRLRRYDGVHDFAFDWYQDADTVWLVDGVRTPYDRETLARMYEYLNARGELYFIEIRDGDGFRPIGDVCFSPDDLPIVIGDQSCRGMGIGRRVIGALIQRARELGYARMRVREIYEYNVASRKCFESMGFRPSGKTEKESGYELEL